MNKYDVYVDREELFDFIEDKGIREQILSEKEKSVVFKSLKYQVNPKYLYLDHNYSGKIKSVWEQNKDLKDYENNKRLYDYGLYVQVTPEVFLDINGIYLTEGLDYSKGVINNTETVDSVVDYTTSLKVIPLKGGAISLEISSEEGEQEFLIMPEESVSLGESLIKIGLSFLKS